MTQRNPIGQVMVSITSGWRAGGLAADLLGFFIAQRPSASASPPHPRRVNVTWARDRPGMSRPRDNAAAQIPASPVPGGDSPGRDA